MQLFTGEKIVMKALYDLKVGTKLTIAFVLTSLVTAIVGYMGIYNMGRIADMTSTSYNEETLGIVHLKQATVELIEMARAEKNLLLSSTQAEREKYGNALHSYQSNVDKELEAARPLVHTAHGKVVLTQVDQAWQERKAIVQQILDLSAKDELSQGETLSSSPLGWDAKSRCDRGSPGQSRRDKRDQCQRVR